MEFINSARPSPIAGSWYAGDAHSLSSQVDAYLNEVKLKPEDLSGEVIGLLAPHAGHRYSGRTAAYAYKAIAPHPRPLVVILSPFHQRVAGDFLTSAFRAYQTPLGEVSLAQEELCALETRLSARGLPLIQLTHEQEHSLEIQLPFLQRVWQTPFWLLPVMLRTHDFRLLEGFAQELHSVLAGKDCLLIASSDLSHFFPLETAQQFDAETLKRIQMNDPRGVLLGEMEGSAPACGAPAIAVMLMVTKMMGAQKVQILNYSTSADASGDDSSVVGYAAAVVSRPLSP